MASSWKVKESNKAVSQKIGSPISKSRGVSKMAIITFVIAILLTANSLGYASQLKMTSERVKETAPIENVSTKE